jgi:hypothetical protein
MTGVAANRGLGLLVAVDAPLHLQRLPNSHPLLCGDISVTTRAIEFRCSVPAMAEKDKAWQLMDDLYRDLPLRETGVTALTLRQRRKARSL